MPYLLIVLGFIFSIGGIIFVLKTMQKTSDTPSGLKTEREINGLRDEVNSLKERLRKAESELEVTNLKLVSEKNKFQDTIRELENDKNQLQAKVSQLAQAQAGPIENSNPDDSLNSTD